MTRADLQGLRPLLASLRAEELRCERLLQSGGEGPQWKDAQQRLAAHRERLSQIQDFLCAVEPPFVQSLLRLRYEAGLSWPKIELALGGICSGDGLRKMEKRWWQ